VELRVGADTIEKHRLSLPFPTLCSRKFNAPRTEVGF